MAARAQTTATAVTVRPPRFSIRPGRVVFLTLALIFTVLALAPFILTVSGSFKTKSEILDWPPTIIPTVFQWQNYVEVWTNSRFFPQWILNSLFLAAFHLGLYLIIASLAGYAFARLKFPGATVIFLAILGSLMVPGQVLWVPKFLILNQVGLVDNLLGIALPDLAEVFGVFFMTQFFKSLPKELERPRPSTVPACSERSVRSSCRTPTRLLLRSRSSASRPRGTRSNGRSSSCARPTISRCRSASRRSRVCSA